MRQREDDIQSLKMRLRFREAGIKRLQTDASEKISAETHLLKEKEEHLKEIEVLRAQVDRNNEATTFAMENLQLKEEIRRHVLLIQLKYFFVAFFFIHVHAKVTHFDFMIKVKVGKWHSYSMTKNQSSSTNNIYIAYYIHKYEKM